MIKFFGEPLREIKSKLSGKVMFRFDSKGEFITDDEEIINRAMGFFDYIEIKAEEVGKKVKKTVKVEEIKIVENKVDGKEKSKWLEILLQGNIMQWVKIAY